MNTGNKSVEDMDRAIHCLALELPLSVHGDIITKWDAVKQSQSSRIKELEELLEKKNEELLFLKGKTYGNS